MNPKLSLVIPTYNEEVRCIPFLKQVLSHLSKGRQSWELLVVDDGSQVPLEPFLKAAGLLKPGVKVLRHEPNLGKGWAVRAGMLASRGGKVAFLDADGSVGLKALDQAFKELDHADVAIASRHMPGARILSPQPRSRILLGGAYRALVKRLLVPVSDLTCGCKAFRREAAFALFSRQTSRRWSFDVEILVLAKKLGLSIAEFPVDWEHREGSKVRVLRAAFSNSFEILRIRLRTLGKV